MSDQYWRKPKKAKVNRGEAWWYANSRGSISVYADAPATGVTIPAAQLREFLNMLDNHKPRKGPKP